MRTTSLIHRCARRLVFKPCRAWMQSHGCSAIHPRGGDAGVSAFRAVGLYIGGGSWLSEPVCQALEREFGRPAISKQSAMIWDTLTRLGAWAANPGAGLSVA